MPMMESEGIGLMLRSPLAGGFLSGKYSRDGAKEGDNRRVQALQRVAALQSEYSLWMREHELEMIPTLPSISISKERASQRACSPNSADSTALLIVQLDSKWLIKPGGAGIQAAN